MIRVSAIVPFFNSEQHLGGCLLSLLGQTLRDLEIVCVDNGSTDRSRRIVEALFRTDSRIRLATCSTRGAGNARNRGLAIARGEYVTFVDADDYLPTRAALEALYTTAVASHAQLSRGNVYTLHHGQDKPSRLATLGLTVWWNAPRLTRYDHEPLLWLPVQHQAYLISRMFLIDNQIYYPNLLRGQDMPFLLKALLLADRIHCSSTPCYVYRKGHRGHAVLADTEHLLAFVQSVLEVRDLLLRARRIRQWHLVLVRTCQYLSRVCPADYLLTDAGVVASLRRMLSNTSELGTLDYSPYSVATELRCTHALSVALDVHRGFAHA